MTRYSGPAGPAYVQVYPDGSTAPGWGEGQFMAKYQRKTFSSRRAEVIYERHQTPFALVMRSVSMVCIDIDGKNGGLESAASMVLPVTLAETSKSGNGYHLFYTVPGQWDLLKGFDSVQDRIKFRTGVDVRGTGCVFHYPQQQWNHTDPVPLPQHFLDELTQRRTDLDERVKYITALRESESEEDQEELLIMTATIQSKLDKPIPAGSRNNTLFAIGAEMNTAGIVGWEKQIYDAALRSGLDDAEAEKLIKNIRRYG